MTENVPSTASRIASLDRRVERGHRSILVAIVVVGIAVTALLSHQVRRLALARASEARTEVARGIVQPVLLAMRQELAELSAFARFIELTRPLSREAFHAFADRVEARYAEVSWVRQVETDARAQAEQLLSDYHRRPMRIEPSAASAERGHMWVQFFTSSTTLGAARVGIDRMHDPGTRELLERVSRSRSIEARGQGAGLDDPRDPRALMLAAPVFEDGTRRRIRGFVLLVFRLRDSIDERRIAAALPGARLTIVQRGEGQMTELFASIPDDEVHREPLLVRSAAFDGGSIEIGLAAPPSRLRLVDRYDPGTGIVGLLFTLLATLLTASQLAVRRRGQHLASERVASESALGAERRERARWQSALSSAGDGVWDWDARTDRVFFSPQWKRMLGYEEDEIGDRLEEWSSRVHPDDLPRAMAAVEAHVRGETASYESVHRLRCKDGEYKWILDRGRVIEWEAPGKAARIIGTHTDVDTAKRLEESLRRANAHLEGVLRAAAEVAIITTDVRGTITGFNAGAERLLGYEAAEVVGKLTPVAFHDAAEMQNRSDEIFQKTGQRYSGFDVFVAHTSTQESDVRMWKYVRKDGQVRNVRLMVAAMRDDAGTILGYVGMAMDVTLEMEQARTIEVGARLLKKLSEQVPGAIYQYRRWPDGRACFPFVSDGIVDVYEVTAAETAVSADSVMLRVHPGDLEGLERSIAASADELTPWVHEYRVVLPRKGVRWLRGEAQPERLPDGSTLWHGYLSDITELKLLQLELLEHATVDPLTRALNRRHLDSSMGRELEKVRTEGAPLSVVMLDIDDFKRVNDTFGHEVGDRVLVAFVELLNARVRTGDRVYRTGGEELLVVCPDTPIAGAERLAESLLESVRGLVVEPVKRVTASFGVAEARGDDTLATLLERADQGVYAAKAAGKDRVHVVAD